MLKSIAGKHDGLVVESGGAAFSQTIAPLDGVEVILDANGHIVYATWIVNDEPAPGERRRWRYIVPAEAILRIFDNVTGEETDD